METSEGTNTFLPQRWVLPWVSRHSVEVALKEELFKNLQRIVLFSLFSHVERAALPTTTATTGTQYVVIFERDLHAGSSVGTFEVKKKKHRAAIG